MTEHTHHAGQSTHLTAALGLGPVTLFGLAYMTPIIVLGIFGIIAEASTCLHTHADHHFVREANQQLVGKVEDPSMT